MSVGSISSVGSTAAWQAVMQLLRAKGRFEQDAYDQACEAAGIPVEEREALRTTFRPSGSCSIRAIPIPYGGAPRRSPRRSRRYERNL
jgi:hypothetical protein